MSHCYYLLKFTTTCDCTVAFGELAFVSEEDVYAFLGDFGDTIDWYSISYVGCLYDNTSD